MSGSEIEILDPAVESGSAHSPRSDHREPDGKLSRSILIGVVLVAVGFGLGMLINRPTEPRDVEDITDTTTTAGSPGTTITTPTAGDSPTADRGDERPTTTRTRTLEATVDPLDEVGSLAGPLTIVPGLDVSVSIKLTPDGVVALAVPARERSLDGADGMPPSIGLPLAPVADGVLFAPISGSALGAVAFWQPGSGASFAIPEAPDTTSYLAATGDLAILLSDGDVVVRDMAEQIELFRAPANVGGTAVVQACVNTPGTLLAVVARSGDGVVFDVATGREVQTFVTDTPLRGVAWTSEHQLAHLAPTLSSGHVVRALDISTGATTDVAHLAQGSNWKLSTIGPSC